MLIVPRLLGRGRLTGIYGNAERFQAVAAMQK